jgi:hypothetical protein
MLKKDENYNCKVVLEQGTELLIHANQMHNLDLDHFCGWKCHAGFDRINIDVDGTVWGGECQNDRLGRLGDWNLLSAPTECKLSTCTGCTDDLIITKWLTTHQKEL